jgi:hypothetical protein
MVGPGEHAVWCQLEVAETLPVWLREMLSSLVRTTYSSTMTKGSV